MSLYCIAKKSYRFLKLVWDCHTAMNLKRYIRRAEKLISYYQDDISVKWLRARERYYMNGDSSIFAKTEKSLHNQRKYVIDEIGTENGTVIVYKNKADMIFKYTKRVFQMSQFRNKCRFISEEEYNNSSDSMLKDNEILFPAMGKSDMNEFIYAVRKKGDWNALLIPRYNILIATTGWQYFDMFQPVENEVVVDAGSFDGQTESEILKWGGEKIKKIYAFESDPENCRKCKKYFSENGLGGGKVQLVEKGIWNKRTVMWIKSAQWKAGSSVGAEGDIQIELTTIDSEVGQDKVTFIKMDIEGAELNALKGAKETIMKNRPRLAICIYHKPEDICEIPEYILSLVPEYRFWIRHYASNEWETVLYAQCL